jgi:hypothetical protein
LNVSKQRLPVIDKACHKSRTLLPWMQRFLLISAGDGRRESVEKTEDDASEPRERPLGAEVVK